MNKQTIAQNVAANMGVQIANLNLQLAQLQTENEQLKARNDELEMKNKNLRKVGERNEPIRDTSGDK